MRSPYKDFENPWGKIAPKSGRVKNISELIDSMVMPGIQGGPLMHIIAAKAVSFGEALKPEFKIYTEKIVENAKIMASELISSGYTLVSGGTDTHVILIDLSNKGITGKVAENTLGKAGLTVNKNMVPFDEKSPFITSGIRVGTSAITTRDMGESEIRMIVGWMDSVLTNHDNESLLFKIKSDVKTLCQKFPIYPD